MPGTSRLILPATPQYPRYSEADLIELKDGRLLLSLARKESSADNSPGSLIGLFSSDQGLTWDDTPFLLQSPFDDVTGLMSVSLCRSPRALHLIFLARGPNSSTDTRVYQITSTDEAKSWSKPQRISTRPGYHIVNNARVILTPKGRLIIPTAFCENVKTRFDGQINFCFLSDDHGLTWRKSAPIELPHQTLMEPGVAPCADNSLYMTIRTTLGHLYESRSTDDGATWLSPPTPTTLQSPAAPSTVTRDPTSDDLWMIWINRAIPASWKQRTPLSLSISHDHGHSWQPPRDLEPNPHHGYGYVSVDIVQSNVLLTYYDWPDSGQLSFQNTSLRQRTIPLSYFHGESIPPVFTPSPTPVLSTPNHTTSLNSGLLVDKNLWRLWYSSGPKPNSLSTYYATSSDEGKTWTPNPTPILDHCYHPSIHREGTSLTLHAWRRDDSSNALYRYTSPNDGKTFTPDPPEAIISSNDAFDLLVDDEGRFQLFATTFKNKTRIISLASSPDGIHFSSLQPILEPDPSIDPPDLQFYGMQILLYRHFYLGLLHTFHAQSQTIQPEWTWSHDGQSFTRTHTPCIPLGDEGSFDSRMILFGSLAITPTQLIYLYTACNWRHNSPPLTTSIGRATLPLQDLDTWLTTLPQP